MPRAKADSAKRYYQMAHFAQRLRERAGNVDAEALHKLWVQEIQDHNRKGELSLVRFYDRQSYRVTRWTVILDGKTYLIVYDSHRKTLATIMFYKERKRR